MRRTRRGLCKSNTGQWTGFSLVELMFVISIFGILTLLAVPQYRKHQAKSKTLEAKVLLARIFTAEENFYLNKGYYSPCIEVLGVAEPKNNHYAVGFSEDAAPTNSNKTGISSNRESCSYTSTGSTPTGSTPAGSTPTGSTPTGSTPTGSTPAGSTPAGSTATGSTATLWYDADKYVHDGGLARGDLLKDATNGIVTSCEVDEFVAGAVGNISHKGEGDKWSINNKKELEHINEGY